MTDTPKYDHRAAAEAWWALIARIAGFVFGAFLIYGQAGAPNPPGAQYWIVLAGVGCMGPTVAASVATILEAARGHGDTPPTPDTNGA